MFTEVARICRTEGRLKTQITMAVIMIAFAGVMTNALGDAKLEVSETNFDFGIIPQVSKVSHSYVMRSTGTDSLRILSVKPACGCTKAPLTKEVVAPGDSTSVELIFTSTEAYRGKAMKSTTVTCNDDERGSFLLRFSASFNTYPDSAKPIQLAPWSLAISEAERGKEFPITVKNVGNAPVYLNLVAVPGGFVNVTMPKNEIAPGATATIKAKVDPKCTETAFEKSFTIECNDNVTTRFTVPVVFGKPQTAAAAGH